MNLLPKWVLTNSYPAVFDSESATTIEMTAKIYAAMQELISDYNSFVDTVNQQIIEFLNDTNKTFEVFAAELRQEFQDFIDIVVLKIQSQDAHINEQTAIINEAVDYMKTNLSNTIDTMVDEWLTEHPEATTTVLNNSLTIDKMVIGTLGYVTPQMFGAVGDGIHDDTAAISQALALDIPLFFPAGTYLINIEPTSSHDERFFFSFSGSKTICGIKGKSIIKLGSNNGNESTYTGFSAIFSFTGTDSDIVIENITFDYNYDNNIPHHYISKNSGVEQNTQNCAVACYHTRDFIVKNCTFIEHSGTNCLNYRGDMNNSRTAQIILENNLFEKCGNPALYEEQPAYHDNSVISIHTDTRGLHNYEDSALIINNIFKGIGGNAFNACEVSTPKLVFSDNYIENFYIGCMPLANVQNVSSFIENNTFKNVHCGIKIWNAQTDYNAGVGIIGFKKLVIDNNDILINPKYWRSIPTYESMERVDAGGYYVGRYYSGMNFGGIMDCSIDHFSISNNNIECYYDDDMSDWNETSGYSFAAINFYRLFDTPQITAFSFNPYIKKLEIINNYIHGCYNSSIYVYTYPEINFFELSNNTIIESNRHPINESNGNRSPVEILFSGKTNYPDNSYIFSHNDIFKASGNVINIKQYTDGAIYLSFSPEADLSNSVFQFVNNPIVKQVYGEYKINGAAYGNVFTDIS